MYFNSCSNSGNLNKTFIIEPLSVTGGTPVLSACTTVFTNKVESCSGNTEILLTSGATVFNTDLVPTVDGFLDILEIKLPSNDVIIEDTSHPGSYRWCGETNKAIGQVVNYLSDIERLQLELSRAIKNKYGWDIFVIKPRAFIVIGTKDNWDEMKKEALRKLNYSLHGIEVLTYTDLIQRGEEIIQRYTQKI